MSSFISDHTGIFSDTKKMFLDIVTKSFFPWRNIFFTGIIGLCSCSVKKILMLENKFLRQGKISL